MQQDGLILNGLEGSGELWLDIMKIICGDTSDMSMIDLGCHKAPYTPLLGFKERTYVDIQNRGMDFKEEEMYFKQQDVISFIKEKATLKIQYDILIASDFLEHLTYNDGCIFLSLIDHISEKQIIFTPIGDYMTNPEATNPDHHKSGWTPTQFNELGWGTIAISTFHPQLNCGAFFAFKCKKNEFEINRIFSQLNKKYI